MEPTADPAQPRVTATNPPGGTRTATVSRHRAGLARRPTLRVTLLWVLLAVVMLRPTPHRISATVAGDLGDSMFLTWTLSWGAHGLWTDPLDVFDANIFHPNDSMLAFSDPMLSLAPVYGVLRVVTGDRITALNLLMIGLFVLALAAAHALGRRLLGRADLAVVVAVVFACNGYVFGQQNHPQIQTLGFLPLAFLALFRAVEHRRARDGWLLALVTVVLTLANLTFGAIWFVSAGVVLAVLALRGRLSPWSTLIRPAWPAAVGTAAVLGPIGLIYRDVGDTHSLERPYEPEHSLLATDVITPQRDNWLWGTSLDGINSFGQPGEHGAFVGLLALALGALGLVLFGLWWLGRPERGARPESLPESRPDEILAVVAAAFVALLLAAGPSPGGVAGPFRLFHSHVPGFESIRATSRFTPVVLLGGAVLVGGAVAWLIQRVPDRARSLVVPLVVVVILLEVWGPMGRVEVPEGDRLLVYEALADEDPGVVLELPIHGQADGLAWPFVEAPRMYHATTDFNRRVNGYSGHVPVDYEFHANLLDAFPSPEALAIAAELEVRYVVLHTGSEQGFAALTESDADRIVAEVEALGFRVERHGEDWLIDLGR